MLYHAKNGIFTLQDSRRNYVRFGTGDRVLILLPGPGDGLTTVKGTALPMTLTSRLITYPRRGHGVYGEEKPFNRTVLNSLPEKESVCTV